jgi:hypothetical protein
MSESPYLTVFVAIVASEMLFKMWNRLLRHLNIRKQGWPPPHCDADGDFKPDVDSENSKQITTPQK